MTNDDMTNDKLYEKAKFFFENLHAVHLTTYSGHWANGMIKLVRPSFILVEDFLAGNELFFYDEISELDFYKNKEERDGGTKNTD